MKRNRLAIKLRIEKFIIEELWQHLLVAAIVFTSAWLFNKYSEAVMFCISHTVIRKYFDKQYHCGTTALCLFTTLSIAFFGIASCLPVALSLLSTVPVCFGISWVGYIAQDRIDLALSVQNRAVKKMSEQELRTYCRECGLDDIDEEIVVQRIIHHRKGKDLYDKIGYSKPQMIRREKRIEHKLNIKLKDR